MMIISTHNSSICLSAMQDGLSFNLTRIHSITVISARLIFFV